MAKSIMKTVVEKEDWMMAVAIASTAVGQQAGLRGVQYRKGKKVASSVILALFVLYRSVLPPPIRAFQS